MTIKVYLYIIFFILISCEQKTNNVELNDDSVLQTVDLSINDIEAGEEIFLGEFSPGQESIPVEIQIFNSNEKYHIEDFKLEFVEQSSMLKFFSDGEAGAVFPGDGGDCTQTLNSLGTCKAMLEFSPIKQGEFKFQVKATYLNLLGPTEHILTFSAFVGVQGELEFVENISSLDFGVFANAEDEYTEKILTVRNIGQIKVENINLEIDISNDQISDFQISKNNCLDALISEDQCEITIKFKPIGDNINSADNFHAASLVIEYDRDSAGSEGTLTKPMRAYSTRIEGKFRLLGAQSHGFEPITLGNETKKDVVFQSFGLKEGIIKSVFIKNQSGQMLGTCALPVNANGYLTCVNDLGASETLTDFPYKMKDLNNCLEKAIKGIEGIGLETNCGFELTFHESYQSIAPKFYSGNILGLNYDSTYQDQETLKSEDFFSFSAESLNSACLSFGALSFELFSGDTTISQLNPLQTGSYCYAHEREIEFDNNNEISVVKFQTANPKNWSVEISNLSGQQISSLEVIMGGKVLSSTSQNLNLPSAYKNVTTTCTALLPNEAMEQKCFVNFDFSLLESTIAQENIDAFDEVLDAANQIGYKYIDIYYNDGANFQDDGVTALAKKRARLKIKMKVERRAFLVVDVTKEGTTDYPVGSPNLPEIRNITLTNQGSKAIPYIKVLADYDEINPNNYGVKILESSSCLSYIDPDISLQQNVNPPDPLVTQLPAGASCELNIHIDQKAYEDVSRTSFILDPYVDKRVNYTSMVWYNLFAPGLTTDEQISGGTYKQAFNVLRTGTFYREYFRDFDSSNNNTMEAWEQKGREIKMDFDFQYYNGDEDAVEAEPDLGVLRPVENRSSPITVGIKTLELAKLIPETVFPYHAALIYRPSLTLPALSIPDYLAAPKSGGLFYYQNRLTYAYDEVPKAVNLPPVLYNAVPSQPSRKGASFIRYYYARANNFSTTQFNPIYFLARTNSFDVAKPFIETQISLESEPENIDYAVHFGTFPSQKLDGAPVEQYFHFRLYNRGQVNLEIKSLKFLKKGTPSASAFTFITPEHLPTSNPRKKKPNQNQIIQLRLSTDTAGVYSDIVEVVYFNGVEEKTKRILVIADVIDDSPRISIKTRSYDVVESTDNNGQVNVSEALEVPVAYKENFNDDLLKYNPYYRYTSGIDFDTEVIKMRAIAGSPVYGKKRIEIVNDSLHEMKTLRVFLGRDMGTKATLADKILIAITNPSQPIYLSRPLAGDNGCLEKDSNGVGIENFNLAAGESCFIDLKYQPVEGSLEAFHELAISYQIQDRQYTLRKLIVHFEPFPPANLIVENVNTVSVQDNSAGGAIQRSYPTYFGGQSDPSHLKLNVFPEIATRGCSTCLSRMKVVNNASKKATLLKAYRVLKGAGYETALIPANGDEHQVAQSGSGLIKVFANRACFYGDDEFDDSLEPEEKGMNFETVAECYLTVKYTDHGQSLTNFAIEERDTVAEILYYNNDWLSHDNFFVHATGFVEPNQMNIAESEDESDYYNVEANSSGAISFSWPKLSEKNANWGTLTSYRVYYSSNDGDFNNIYRTQAAYVDVPTESVSFNPGDFAEGEFVYFRVVGLRSKAVGGTDKLYISESPLGILQIVVPPADMTYIYEENILLSHKKSDDLMSKTAALSNCQSQDVELLKNNSTLNFPMSLMGANEWSYIESDSGVSDYSNAINIPHWTTQVSDIEEVLEQRDLLDQYNPSVKIDAFSAPDYLVYMKNCTNLPSCNMLSLIRGGDEAIDLYLNGYLYVDEAVFDKAYSRCVVELP